VIVVAVAVLIVSAVWSAAHDDGLVVDVFSVPPDMAQRGLTGDFVASHFLDRLTDLISNGSDAESPKAASRRPKK
jgi:hypothetical protein